MNWRVLYLLLIVLALASLCWGSAGFYNFGIGGTDPNGLMRDIFLQNRLPRTLLAIIAGSGSALVGLVLQTVFKNSLAGPTTLGVNSGASLGVAFYYFLAAQMGLFMGINGAIFFAVIGAMGFLFLILLFSRHFKSVNTLLIVGILLGYLAYALIEILMQVSSSTSIQSYVFWGMGSFNFASFEMIAALGGIVLLVIIWVLRNSEALNVYLLGEDELKLLGFQSRKIKFQALFLCGLMIGVLTSIAGPIAFVGIIVPNLLKYLRKTLNHKKLLESVLVLGAIFTLLADFLARGIVWSFVLPLNALLSLMSIPVVLILFLRKNNGTTEV